MQVEMQRTEMDALDERILSLLEERAGLAKRIGEAKRAEGRRALVPGREEKIVNELVKKSKGVLPGKAIDAIWAQILGACRALEEPMKVAFLGPEASYTHAAAEAKFGSGVELMAKPSIPAIFLAVEKGEVQHGVVPIENSGEGTVNTTFNLLVKSDVNIVAEIGLEIRHCLASRFRLDEVKRVFSHPQALAQCVGFLAKTLPKAELVEVASTSDAAEKASLHHSCAAIASEHAAKRFGLNVLAENVNDEAQNQTRFLVLGKTEPVKTGRDKSTVVFSVKHRAGALVEALKVLQRHDLNMTKLWSMPTVIKRGDYAFLVDFQGFAGDDNVKNALKELEEHCGFVKLLGSYPERV